jgi:hypothetical protein
MNARNVLLAMMAVIGSLGGTLCTADTIMLQQGLNGYSGCQDCTIDGTPYSDAYGSYTVNYGIDRSLILNSENFRFG